MQQSPDITQWSLSSQARALACGELSCSEVVAAHIAKIKASNPLINAIVQLASERALEEATIVDRAPQRRPSALRGLPFTVKDNFETQGVVTAIGMSERRDLIPSRDAALVSHVRCLGGVLLGKTNCPPGGGGLFTDNDVYGRTNNPYDLSRTPGGSSGGEAAAVAAGMSPYGFGTDSGGSVRVPAHFCGIAAILPTARLLPVSGVVDDEGPIGMISDPRTRVGVMARSVADLDLILRAITPIPATVESVVPLVPKNPAEVSLSNVRIAVQTDNGFAPPTEGTQRTIDDAAQILEHAGASMLEADLPIGGHELTHEVWRSYGGEMHTAELYSIMRRWDLYRREVMTFFQTFDAILCPVFDTPAPEHGTIETNGEGVSYTTPYSLTDSPSVVVRCGTSDEGLPIGLQIVAGPWRDEVALALAGRLEAELGGWSPPPNLPGDTLEPERNCR